jgi:hypothetical protein
MLRTSEADLLDFCAGQRDHFDETVWLAGVAGSREQLGAAAMFLSTVDWYGHGDALQRVAVGLVPEWIDRLADLSRTHEFDLARFSHMLRHRLDHVSATA